MAKIYTSAERRPDAWEPFTKAGAILFLRDASRNDGIFLRLVDIEETGRTEVIWEHELYVQFRFQKATSYFYTFESDVIEDFIIVTSNWIGLRLWSDVC